MTSFPSPSFWHESVRCDLCGSERDRPRLTIDLDSVVLSTVWIKDVAYRLSGRETLVECEDCGLVYVNPRLVEIPGLALYSYEQEKAYFNATRTRRASAYLEIWRQMPRWLGQSPRSLLDIGCGDGVLLDIARQAGADVMGLEISAPLIHEVRQRLGQVVWEPETAPLAEASFDVVALLNVIEHLRSPRQMLEAASRWVRPGGVVLVHVPNFGGWPARLSRAHWHQIEPLEHFYYFTPRTLTRLLQAVGLVPVGRFSLITSIGWRARLQRWMARFGLYIDNGLGIVARRKG